MKPLTNETLIEEKIRALVKELFYLAHVDYDENMAEANMTPPDEEGVRIIKGFLDSAIQAKEREIQEKIIGEIEKRFKMFEQSKTGWMITGINIRLEDWKEFKSKLSNLSEK